MASDSEVHILSLIESSDAGVVLSSVSAYLRPFLCLLTSREEDRTQAVESIAKQFIPFLTKSISSLHKRLSVPGPAQESLADLFGTYDFCLECCEVVTCDSDAVQLERLRLIHCYQNCGWFTQAYNDAFRVLDQLRGPGSNFLSFLPNRRFGEEAKLASLVVDVVASIVRSVAMSRDMDDRQYSRVLLLLREIKPWLGYLDAHTQDKMLTLLVSDMGECALSILREAERFDEDLLHGFCISTLEEYSISPLPKSHFYKFSRQVLSLLIVSKERKTSKSIKTVMSVLQTVACEFQVQPEENWLELVGLVAYCAHKSQLAGNIWCAGVSKQLSEIAAGFSEVIPQANVILRLYSAGLSINVFDVKFREKSKETTENWGFQALLADKDICKSLVSVLGMVDQYSDNKTTSNDGNKKSEGQTYVSHKHKGKTEYTLPYLDALKFLCQPLASLINFENKKMVLETEFACDSGHLSVIQDTFLQFCCGFRFLQRWTPEESTDFDKTVLNVAIANFIISMRTQLKVEITSRLVEDVIASPWISPPELKHLFASFHDIGVAFYSIKHLKKASMAFKLCIKTVWTCVRLHCQIFVNVESSTSEDFLSGEAIIDFVSEACSKSAFYLDVLHQHGAGEIEKLVVFILEHWSAAEDLITRLPDPTPIIQQWVKIQRRRHESLDLAGSWTPFYSLLSSSQKILKRLIRDILEQELLAYEEILPLRSELCRAKQSKIADILLKDVFITKDLLVERARILIWKARMTRDSGAEHLNECVHYLSEAISISGNTYNEPTNYGTLCCFQLAIAYSLRALCIQETEPDSKQVFEDVNTSLNLWLRIQTPCDSDSIPLENVIPLLCNVIDLLSIKGWIELHRHMFGLMFKIFKWKNVKLEVCLAMLWDCRRLSHALCPCPINDVVIKGLSDYFGEKSESTDFWISCLQFSKAKLIGFQLRLQCSLHETLHTSNKHEYPHKSDITIDDINSKASKLVSSDPFPSYSSFVAASLYYDLCERQLPCGNLYEALSYANEAHRIRHLFFKDRFSYVEEKRFEKHNRAGKTIEILTYVFNKFEVSSLRATDMWPCGNFFWDINRCLSPLIVLQCYLESILQVGVINELIGEGVTAERFLSWGKAISCMQSLQPFVVAFSLALGNLYNKMQCLDLAAKELQNAKELLIDSQRNFSCQKCMLMLDVKLDKQLGDLSQRRFDNTTRVCQTDGLSHAESLFSAALRKLCCSAWKGCINNHQGKEIAEVRDMGNSCVEFLGHESKKSDPCIKEKPTDNRDSKRRRRGVTINLQACLTKEHNLTSEPSLRLTRSMSRSQKELSQNCSADMHIGISKKRSFSNRSDLFDICDEKELLLDIKNKICSICVCINRKGQQCLSNEVTRSGLLNNLISLKWQFHQRRLACTVLDSLGKCLAKAGKVHQAHGAILHNIAVLYNSNVSILSSPSSLSPLLDFIGKEIKGDVFGVDRARILYNLCKLSVQTSHSRASRSICCDLSHITSQKLVSWLTLAFVLSREVPILNQKISRLLAALYLLSLSRSEFSFPCDGELSVTHWVTYYHQASLGAHINNHFLSNFIRRHKSGCNSDKEFNLQASRLSYLASAEFDFLRLAPESTEDLVKFAKNFFNSLSEPTVICISMLGGTLSKLFQEIMKTPPVCAWLLLSRLSSKSQPIAVLLPVDSVLGDGSGDNSNLSNTEAAGIEEMGKRWDCPWGSTVVDVVAPAFKLILQENFITGSEFPVEDVHLRWKTREQLNLRLAKLLRNLEDLWLGPWRHLLLGESSNSKLHESTQKKLVKELRSKCKLEVNETLLKVFLGNGPHESKGEAWISQLCLKNGCYIGRCGHIDEEDGCAIPTSTSNDPQRRYRLALELIRESEIKLTQLENNVKRKPIILVLDHEIQMLPWENIPILRRQEVYRMPSVGSISAVLKKCCYRKDPAGCFSSSFPLIDPQDAYYLLNPSGDLRSLQIKFERWFKEKKLKGRSGLVPVAKELTDAVEKHDLFIYFGRGTGEECIPMSQVKNFDKCAAAFPMGCSSGSPYRRGKYVPISIPLSFLLADSPVVIANLWGVTGDINRFGKTMLEGCLRERSDDVKSETVGSLMADARDACTLQFLTGAAPVCYGVPTAITKRKKKT